MQAVGYGSCGNVPNFSHHSTAQVFSVLLLGNGMLPVLPTNFSQAMPEKAQADGHQHRARSLPMLKKPQY